MRDGIEKLSGQFATIEIEHVLDQAIDGLTNMDVEVLVQIATLCSEWEGRAPRLSRSDPRYARLSWKLLLLDRLLRQTRMNLSVLGLRPRLDSGATGYATFDRR